MIKKICVTILLFSPTLQAASLLSDVSYNRFLLSADQQIGGNTWHYSQNLVGTSLPVDQSLVLITSNAGITSDYHFFDNGSTAGFTISTSYSTSGSYVVDEEAPSGNTAPFQFTATQSLAYDVIGNSYATTGSGGLAFLLNYSYNGNNYSTSDLFAGISYPNNSFKSSGVIPVYAIVTLYVSSSGSDNTGSYFANSSTGGSSLSINLSPVVTPIPASIWLFGSGLMVLLRFRREGP